MKKYREELYRKTAYCPTCRGVTPQGCPRCGGVGLVVVPATRGDVLRRMSDKELAVQLFDFRFDGYANAAALCAAFAGMAAEAQRAVEEQT